MDPAKSLSGSVSICYVDAVDYSIVIWIEKVFRFSFLLPGLDIEKNSPFFRPDLNSFDQTQKFPLLLQWQE